MKDSKVSRRLKQNRSTLNHEVTHPKSQHKRKSRTHSSHTIVTVICYEIPKHDLIVYNYWHQWHLLPLVCQKLH